MIRVLGKGLTAQAIKDEYKDVVLYDDNDFDKYDKKSDDLTVVSPGIPPFNEMVKCSNNIISDYDLVANEMPFSIWISGTNGKTTTTQMCQHILEEKGSVCGGNIGTPVSKLNKQANIWILETSSFTFHYTKNAKPNIYLLLPISDDHISWHGSFMEYEKAKLKPLNMMEEGEIAIVPDKYKDIDTKCKLITYKNSDELCKKFAIDKSKIDFKEPFLLDALLALIAKKVLFDELDYEKINSYKVDEHKIEELKDKKNRLWVNDSKATNIDATINALIPYKDKKIYLILGGDDKQANLEPLFEYMKGLDIEIYTIGSNCKRLNKLGEKFSINFKECNVLEKAIKEISKKLDLNGVAILSPAAASLDQYTSYKERGKEFKKFISKLSLF